MKWKDIEEQFFQAAKRLESNIDYITNVSEAFEKLVAVLYVKDPHTCVEFINQDAEIIGKIFVIEDPESIPPEAIAVSSDALEQTQRFLLTFLRVAAMFNSMQAAPPDLTIPPNTKIH